MTAQDPLKRALRHIDNARALSCIVVPENAFEARYLSQIKKDTRAAIRDIKEAIKNGAK